MSQVKNTEICADYEQRTLTDYDSGFICAVCHYNDLKNLKLKID